MKTSALTAIALLALGVACTDATSPSFNKTVPKGPAKLGHIPPPPVDADIAVCVDGAGCTVFDGTYFSNGGSSASGALALELADPSLDFQGTAWVRFNNKQTFGGIATANARFKNTNGNLSGNGTIQFGLPPFVAVIKLDDVDFFAPNPACDTGEPCAIIVFRATVNGVPNQRGEAFVYNKDFCTGTGEGGEPVFDCRFPGSDFTSGGPG